MGAKRKTHQKFSNYHNNVIEFEASTQRKKIVHLSPRNANQELYVNKLLNRQTSILLAIGPAGTGKTMLAVQAAVKLFKEEIIDRIVITRPAVSVDEELGFLPGTLEQKMDPWVRPIFDVIREYFSLKEIQGMIQEQVIEIAPLAYMRGRTFRKSFIVADEIQLSTANQMKMLLTRIGEGSKMVITGDLDQADRKNNNGLQDFLQRFDTNNAKRIDLVRFDATDIERHPAVKEVLSIYDK